MELGYGCFYKIFIEYQWATVSGYLTNWFRNLCSKTKTKQNKKKRKRKKKISFFSFYHLTLTLWISFLGKTQIKTTPSVRETTGDGKENTLTITSTIIYPIIGCTIGLVFLVLAFFVWKRVFGATKPSIPINPPGNQVVLC